MCPLATQPTQNNIHYNYVVLILIYPVHEGIPAPGSWMFYIILYIIILMDKFLFWVASIMATNQSYDFCAVGAVNIHSASIFM